uniref:Uncharacterized protein n=1 Tax=Anguilla anguilla TaxID=7936 RepID=A0A0E9W850_ANGAN
MLFLGIFTQTIQYMSGPFPEGSPIPRIALKPRVLLPKYYNRFCVFCFPR